jgi:hypothetical protein
MKIAFFSNFLNHHQYQFCDSLFSTPGIEFRFISRERLPDERKIIGYPSFETCPFVLKLYDKSQIVDAHKFLDSADVLIVDTFNDPEIKEAAKNKKLIFLQSEHFDKGGFFRESADLLNIIIYADARLRATTIYFFFLLHGDQRLIIQR